MKVHNVSCRGAGVAKSTSFARRLRSWWQSRDAADRYLAEAADLADLERRMRVLDRARGGPAFVTYNH